MKTKKGPGFLISNKRLSEKEFQAPEQSGTSSPSPQAAAFLLEAKKDKMEENQEEMTEEIITYFRDGLEEVTFQTQSPIEKLFLLGFLALMEDYFEITFRGRIPLEHVPPSDEISHGFTGEYGVFMTLLTRPLQIIPQFHFAKNFIVDFLFYLPGKETYIVVECDGHDFHEKTKDQARKDKQRDRWLTHQGITVLRFTGSEIYQNVKKVTKEVLSILYKKI